MDGGLMTGEASNKHLTAREFVLEGIRDAMLDGRITAGQELDDQALAEEFGVSRTPVREALKVLEVQGFIAYPRRFSKPIVAPISSERIEEIYLMRIALEGVAATRLCQMVDVTELARLERLARLGTEALTHRDVEAWSRYNREFHIGLAAIAKMQLLCREVASLVDLSSFYSRMFWQELTPVLVEAGREHEDIVRACRQKDAVQATRLIQNHLTASCRTQVKLAREREAPVADARLEKRPSGGQLSGRGKTLKGKVQRRRQQV